MRIVGADGEDGGNDTTFIAGGTQIVDLIALGVVAPETLVDLGNRRQSMSAIERTADGLRIGALATMSEAAAHPHAQAHPALVQSLVKAASPQIRNMATIGGNLLQRTRCTYFRDGTSPCNKREPSSGCAALNGDRHGLAILGTSRACIANYPGDLAVALVALDASVEVRSHEGLERTIAAADLHRLLGSTPHIETVLEPGDLTTAVTIPDRAWTASTYVKVRERASYAFALASCAVAAKLDDCGTVTDIRIALGGIASKPWRCPDAETLLVRSRISEERSREAAKHCTASLGDHAGRTGELARRTVMRALQGVASRDRS